MSLITISTHVLDSSTGHPVPNMCIEVYTFSHQQSAFTFLRTIHTDQTGRNMDVLGNKTINPTEQNIPHPETTSTSGIPTTTMKSEHLLDGLTEESKHALETYQHMYKLRFHTANYYKAQSVPTSCFYPYVDIVFQVDGESIQDSQGRRHYHLPLILSPFGYTTYRGS
mmetsp:Transcript_17720/g.30787  ORF Transcript_17720/g.30787 Transcript_17720/m.30787 type:complete len:168 (+) Transcript_17720:75-578(+)